MSKGRERARAVAATGSDERRLASASVASAGRTARGFVEEAKTLPFGAVWDHYCEVSGVPAGFEWLQSVTDYETRVLALRH